VGDDRGCLAGGALKPRLAVSARDADEKPIENVIEALTFDIWRNTRSGEKHLKADHNKCHNFFSRIASILI